MSVAEGRRTNEFGHSPTDVGGHGEAGLLDGHWRHGAEIVRGRPAGKPTTAGDGGGGVDDGWRRQMLGQQVAVGGR